MRRSEYDVTDRIRTTDTAAVEAEVLALYLSQYPRASPRRIKRAFSDLRRMYEGADPGFHPCDTEYHDIQHVMDVTLAMARLMDGHLRSRGGPHRLAEQHYVLGVVTALYHDIGYIRRRGDRLHRYGAEYTLTHVSRGSAFLRAYLPRLGMGSHAQAAATLVHFTGYERNADTIRMADPLLRHLGQMLGSADIIAQMSDRCYLEKCRDRLYPEFVLGGLARRRLPGGRTQIIFKSGDDVVRKTPGFYQNAIRRLDRQLASAYQYAEPHFGGQNVYLDEMQKNVRYAKQMATHRGADLLRRTPPLTLQADVEPYPKELVIR